MHIGFSFNSESELETNYFMKSQANIQIQLSMSDGSGEVSLLVDESGKNNHVFRSVKINPEWLPQNMGLLFGNKAELSLPIMSF